MIPHFEQLTIPKPRFIGAGNWHLENLSAVTVLFGKNGCGKSVLLRAIRDTQVENAHYVVPERSGELVVDSGFIQYQLNSQKRREYSMGNFASEYRRLILARIQAYYLVRGSSRALEMPVPPSEVEGLLNQLLPDFAIELKGDNNPPYQLTRVSDGSPIQKVEQLSSGEAQLLCLGLDILTVAAIWEIKGATKRLILVDEPDAHIHADLQARFADFLIQVSTKYNLQVILATHSTTLLAAIGQFGGSKTGVVYVDRISSVFKARRFDAILKELAACLGGHALMGPLFGVPLLLVEGDDDYRIWSQVPRHHKTSFAVIPSNGDEIYEYQRVLEKIFGSLRAPSKPAGFALLDGDKNSPQPNPRSPQDHVQFVNLRCREAENLFLTDEVLGMVGTSWSRASATILKESSQYGNKASKLASVQSWNRQSEDLKDVINEINKIVDSKNVHWTLWVGRCIGRNKPSGQLADFLGPALIAALWA